MEVHVTPEQQAQFAQIATKPEPTPSDWRRTLLLAISTKKPAFLAAVEKGMAAAERGEFIEQEEMDARL
jgi:predicted transcriptional regulator